MGINVQNINLVVPRLPLCQYSGFEFAKERNYKKFIKILLCNAGLVSDRRVRISVCPLKRSLVHNWPKFLSFSTTIENRCKRNWPKMFFKRWEGTTFVVKHVPHCPLRITYLPSRISIYSTSIGFNKANN